MKVQYVAEDGTTFDNEVECKQHELHTAFGSDARFVNAVDEMLTPLIGTDDRGNGVIWFDTEEEDILIVLEPGDILSYQTDQHEADVGPTVGKELDKVKIHTVLNQTEETSDGPGDLGNVVGKGVRKAVGFLKMVYIDPMKTYISVHVYPFLAFQQFF